MVCFTAQEDDEALKDEMAQEYKALQTGSRAGPAVEKKKQKVSYKQEARLVPQSKRKKQKVSCMLQKQKHSKCVFNCTLFSMSNTFLSILGTLVQFSINLQSPAIIRHNGMVIEIEM